MASSCLFIDKQTFLCGLCGEVFTLPVTTPCGHTFCRACLQRFWDEGRHLCPTCTKPLPTRPEIQVNTVLAELSADFKRQQAVPPTPDPSSSANGVPGGDDEVLCDICAESKDKAVRSCLRCLCSFCEKHLEPHRRVAGLRCHPLVAPPVAGLEGRLCRSHRRAPDVYCRTDQAWLCHDCVKTGEHRGHHIVTLEEECDSALAEPPETAVAELQGPPAGAVMDVPPRRVCGAMPAANAGRRRREVREGNGGQSFFQTARWKN